MLEVGSVAPEFRLPGSDGECIREYSLAEFVETGAAVLVFYPFDFSPVCKEELCEVRDSEWLTFTPGLDVVGVSTDSAYAHRAVVRGMDLPFPLVSDHDGSVSETYDALYDELESHPRVSKRTLYVVDDSRTVRYAWQAEEWKTGPDVGKLADATRELDCVDSRDAGS